MPDISSASAQRLAQSEDEAIDSSLRILLARYEAVTADKQKMSYLRFLLKHYSGHTHIFTDCVRDNARRFGPKTKGLCAVVKDLIRQNTMWRHGPPKGPHVGHPDFGSPGVDIVYADVPGTKQWPYGHIAKLSDVPEDIWLLLHDISEQCDPCRVLLGLDPAPSPSATFLAEYAEAA